MTDIDTTDVIALAIINSINENPALFSAILFFPFFPFIGIPRPFFFYTPLHHLPGLLAIPA
jgi:hypothetical protein